MSHFSSEIENLIRLQYARQLNAGGGYRSARLEYDIRLGQLFFRKHADAPVVQLSGKHALATSSPRPYHHLKGFLLADGGDYVATCGYHNDWLFWNAGTGLLVGRTESEDFYAPASYATLAVLGRTATLRLSPYNNVSYEISTLISG
jgi:hypothetical protein